MYCLIPEYQSPFLMSSAVESSCRCKVASRVSAGVAEGVGTGVGVFLTIAGVGVATAVAACIRVGGVGGRLGRARARGPHAPPFRLGGLLAERRQCRLGTDRRAQSPHRIAC